jgi:hypothetical protein
MVDQAGYRIDYYIDESGNSGDLANYDGISSAQQQPSFSLAAIGFEGLDSLDREIERLKRDHRVRLTELKSSALQSRPEFILELVRFLCDEGRPYFVEIVDNKYFLCMNITTRQLLPPIPGRPEDARINYVRNEMADYLHEYAPDEVFEKFLAACKTPSDRTLRAGFAALLEFSRNSSQGDGRAQAIHESASLALDEYKSALKKSPNAHLDYLPLPDDSKRGRPIWMLPNLTSLTNIYARINLCEGGNIAGVRLIHDEQAHFDTILQSSKGIAEGLGDRAAMMFTPYSDFDFRESAPLSFARSLSSTGLQVADVVAGFCMRYARDFFEDPRGIPHSARETFGLLIEYSNPRKGIGINLVMSTQRAHALMRNGF